MSPVALTLLRFGSCWCESMMPGDAATNESRSVLDWLLAKYPETPKTRAKQWIASGRVRAHGSIVRKPHQLITNPGDTLELLGRHTASVELETSWRIHPRVGLIHIDSSLAILNKGPGIVSVPAPQAKLSALSVLEDFLSGKLRPVDRGAAARSLPSSYRQLHPLPVHRLDQYTSGLFCVALTPRARLDLIEQVARHTMKRQYIAFVDGRAPASEGSWRHWLQLSDDELVQRVVSSRHEKGSRSRTQEAITHFEVLAEYPIAGGRRFVTKLRLRLETGRRHQIRVQAASVGLPLIGDRKYHPDYRENSDQRDRIEFPRQ